MLRRAPEHFLDAEGIARVQEEARSGRRGFLRGAFASAMASAAGLAAAQANPVTPDGGDPNILELPDQVLDLLEEGDLSEGHGRALLAVKGQDERRKLARQAVAEG